MRLLSSIGLGLFVLLACFMTQAQENAGQEPPRTPVEAVLVHWDLIGEHLITMAQDFPEDKYNYHPNDQVRSFAAVLRHVAGCNFSLIQLQGKKSMQCLVFAKPSVFLELSTNVPLSRFCLSCQNHLGSL